MTRQEPKKPLNSFFHYRKSKKQEIVRNHHITKSHEISKKAAELWAKESKEVRDHFHKLSLEEHNKFKEQYPDYDWQPWKRNPKSPRSPSRSPVLLKSECKRLSEPLATSPKYSPVRLSKSSTSLNAFQYTPIMTPKLFYKVSPDVLEAAKLPDEINFNEFMDSNVFSSPTITGDTLASCGGSPVSTCSFDHYDFGLELFGDL
ncbi:hypothetical protein HDV01_006066 [Terramyces sp. JEL0728]|nr:hypothetical protein HDV01_006066 [Terramyces sp. JEL0728]